MQEKALRKIFLGFIQLHILHHAYQMPFYGTWMIEELKEHGYSISPGTLYPTLHSLEKDGLLLRDNRNVAGKIRKYYSITDAGTNVLKKGKKQALELIKELEEWEGEN